MVHVVEWVDVNVIQILVHLPLPGDIHADGKKLGDWCRFLHVGIVATLKILD